PSMVAKNARLPSGAGCARNANGMIREVSNTSSRLRPSTPTRYSALIAGIHAWRSTNWSPVAVASKFRHSAKAHPAEMILNSSAIGRPFRSLPAVASAAAGGHVHTARAPSSGIKIIAVTKPTMRREEEAPTSQQRRRQGKFESVQSARWTTDGPNRERQLWFHLLRR